MRNKLWEVDNLTILQKLNIVNKMLTEEYKKQLFLLMIRLIVKFLGL